MISYFVAFLCSLMVGVFLTLAVRNLAVRFGLVEQAKSSRKVHSKPIPRLGGIAIVAGFFAPLAGLLLVDSSVGDTFRANGTLVVGLFAGGLAIAALGLYDDLRGAGAKVKFAVQFGVAGGLYALGFRIEQLANPFGDPVSLGILALPLTLVWVVGVINAMNLIDGLDGLAGGVAFFAVATNFLLALFRGDVLLCLAMAALAGAVLGFLVFNFNPASIFMGDTGSMFLGFVLAAVSLKTSSKSGTAVAILVPIISLGLPIMDTLLAMTRRMLMGRPMFSADKEHIHHRLMSRLVMSQRRAVLVLYGVCCLFALTALGLTFANSAQTAMLLGGIATVVFVLMRKLGYLSLENKAVVQETRKRNIQLRSVTRGVIDACRSATSVQALWDAVRPAAEALDASVLRLRLGSGDEQLRDAVTWEVERSVGTALPLVARVEVRTANRVMGEFTVDWRDGRDQINRDEELMLELIADDVGDAFARIRAREQAEPRRVLSFRR